MRFAFALVSIIPLLSFAGAASATTQTDMVDCQQMRDLDRSITGCTNLASDQSLDAHDRAIAYLDRGLAYYAKNDLDHAIDDWSEAIKLDPSYLHAYNNRGKAYRAKGDYAQAIADYSQAIKLDPQHAVAYKGRGIAYLLSGDPAKAEADFRQAADLDPADQYAVLWLDIATRRNNQPSHIAQTAKALNMSAWPAPIVFLFAGQMTPHDVAVAAQNIDPLVTQTRNCDAYFYIGEFGAAERRQGPGYRPVPARAQRMSQGRRRIFRLGCGAEGDGQTSRGARNPEPGRGNGQKRGTAGPRSPGSKIALRPQPRAFWLPVLTEEASAGSNGIDPALDFLSA